MADHYLGAAPILRGNLILPRVGAWHADVYLSADTISSLPSVGAQTTLTTGNVTRVCAITKIGADYLQLRCRLVGGYGKLDTMLEARDYQGYTASEIAQDALRDAGEVPGTWSHLTRYCAQWTRSQGPCRESLRRLTRLLTDAVWRVQDDGKCETVIDEFKLNGATFNQLASSGDEGVIHLGVYDSAIRPGDSIVAWNTTRQIDSVLYTFDRRMFNATCWYIQ